MSLATGRPTALHLEWRSQKFHMDRPLLLATTGILGFGYVMVTSASLHLGEKVAGESFYYPLHQLGHILLGLCAALAVCAMPVTIWERAGQWLFILGLALLVLVLIPSLGVKVNGSVRWLSVGGVRIQVSEIVKMISVIYMAGYMTRHLKTMRKSAYGMFRPLLLLSLAGALLLLEPDFGSAAVIVATALGMMFVGGARLWHFFLLILGIALLGVLLVCLSSYRLARVTSFVNPWADPLDTGFQLIQALIAFGRGEWMGVGLGGSVQKLFFLPEAHTDFLFSVLAEELGLIGSAVVIVLFATLVWRAFLIGYWAEATGQRFSAFLAYGLGIWFGLQAFINIGVNMGMLPTKGLTLPLMSYGGGSMIVMCASLAMLYRIYHETVEIIASTPKRKPQWLGV